MENEIKVVGWLGHPHDADLTDICSLLADAQRPGAHVRLCEDPLYKHSEVGAVIVVWQGPETATDEELFTELDKEN